MSGNFYCIDLSNVQIINDNNSLISSALIINFQTVQPFCDGVNDDEIDCVWESDYREKMEGKAIVLLHN